MNLRDQLLKAGLVSKKQVEKTEANSRKQEHNSKKNKELSDALQQEKNAELAKIEEEKNQRRELDKELNLKRDMLMMQRENHYRARQILNSQCLNEKDANEPYFFLDGTFVRKIMVTPMQREKLARGRMAIARPLEDIDEFVLISFETAQLILEIFASKLLVLHTQINDSEELDAWI